MRLYLLTLIISFLVIFNIQAQKKEISRWGSKNYYTWSPSIDTIYISGNDIYLTGQVAKTRVPTYSGTGGKTSNSYVLLGLTTSFTDSVPGTNAYIASYLADTVYYGAQSVMWTASGETQYRRSSTKSITIGINPPTVPDAIGGDGVIDLRWDGVTRAFKYSIYEATTLTGTYNWIASTTSLTYQRTGLSDGVTRYYKIRTVRKDSSSLSSVCFATTDNVLQLLSYSPASYNFGTKDTLRPLISQGSSSAGNLFSIDNEEGDTSDYDAVVQGAGSTTFSSVAAAKRWGTYGAMVDFDGTNLGSYGQMRTSGSQSTEVYGRFYFKSSAINTTGTFKLMHFLELYDSTNNRYLMRLGCKSNGAGAITSWAVYFNDSVATNYTSATNFNTSNNHLIEYRWKQDWTAGGAQIWIDSTLVFDHLDRHTKTASNYSVRWQRIGNPNASSGVVVSASDYFYFDSWTSDNTSRLAFWNESGATNDTTYYKDTLSVYAINDGSSSINITGLAGLANPFHYVTTMPITIASGDTSEIKIYLDKNYAPGTYTDQLLVINNGDDDTNYVNVSATLVGDYVPPPEITPYYVKAGATGNNDGSSWTNAWPSLTSIDWTKIIPGDVIEVSGGVDSLVYNTGINFPESGTAGNPIIFRKSYQSGNNGKVVIVPTSGNAIGLYNRSYITVKGFSIHNPYDNSNSSYNIQIDNCNNILIDSCQIVTNSRGIYLQENESPIEIKNCTITTIADNPNNSQMDCIYSQRNRKLIIHHNQLIQKSTNLDEHNDCYQNYQDGKDNSNALLTTLDFYNNLCWQDNTRNTNASAVINTYGWGWFNYYNNLIINKNNWNQGIGVQQNSAGGTNMKARVYNNTFIGGSINDKLIYFRYMTASDTVDVRNNIIYSENYSGPGVNISDSPNITIANWDYNIYWSTYSGWQNYAVRFNGTARTLTSWQSSGYDTHGKTNNPLFVDAVNGNYRISNLSPALDAAITLGLFNIDYYGTARPRGNGWDTGYYEKP